jgi:DNA-binding MarR family transcriptional regulator
VARSKRGPTDAGTQADRPVTGSRVDRSVDSVTTVDTRYLESLVGYNARRAALAIIGEFLQRMAPYGLRPVDFSVLSLVKHNPGVTARQICTSLGLLPPNLVGMLKALERRGLVQRKDHPQDRRAYGLHLSAEGRSLMEKAEKTATTLERDVTAALSDAERSTLMQLLQKVYLS